MTTGVSSSDMVKGKVIGGEEIMELSVWMLKSLRTRTGLASEGMTMRQEPKPSRNERKEPRGW